MVAGYKSGRTSRRKCHLNSHLNARASLAKVWGELFSELQTSKLEAENNLARSGDKGKAMKPEG